jgi:tetratricopeptide (TPR) repeat protein
MLNYTQQAILQAILNQLLFEDDDYLRLLPAHASIFLESVFNDSLYEKNYDWIQSINLLDNIVQLRRIINHDCPQNVCESIFEDNSGYVVYMCNRELCSERQGLLALSTRNDDTAEGVTKRDVVKYINDCIQMELQIQSRINRVVSSRNHGIQAIQSMWNALTEINKEENLADYYCKYIRPTTFLEPDDEVLQQAFENWSDKVGSNTVDNFVYSYIGFTVFRYVNLENTASMFSNLINQINEYMKRSQLVEKESIVLNRLVILSTYHRAQLTLASSDGKEGSSSDLDTIIELDPSFYLAYLSRGDIHLVEEQYEFAIAEYRKALEVKDDVSDVHTQLGIALVHAERLEEGIIHLNRAVKLNHYNTRAFVNLSSYYFTLGDWDKVMENSSRAIDLCPSISELYKQRGQCYQILERYEDAVSDYERCIVLKGEVSDLDRIICFLGAGKNEDALQYCTTLITKADPAHDQAGLLCSRSLIYSKRFEKYDLALVDITAALQIYPENEDYIKLKQQYEHELGINEKQSNNKKSKFQWFKKAWNRRSINKRQC